MSLICTASNANDQVQVNRKKKEGGVWAINNQVQQPLAFKAYNSDMNTVDRSDQILAAHNVQRKCLGWWKARFFHLIDLAVVNSFILFKEQQSTFPDIEQLKLPRSYNLENFREELVRNICALPPTGPPLASIATPPQPPPRGEFDLEHSPIFWILKGIVLCVAREENREGRRNYGQGFPQGAGL